MLLNFYLTLSCWKTPLTNSSLNLDLHKYNTVYSNQRIHSDILLIRPSNIVVRSSLWKAIEIGCHDQRVGSHLLETDPITDVQFGQQHVT